MLHLLPARRRTNLGEADERSRLLSRDNTTVTLIKNKIFYMLCLPVRRGLSEQQSMAAHQAWVRFASSSCFGHPCTTGTAASRPRCTRCRSVRPCSQKRISSDRWMESPIVWCSSCLCHVFRGCRSISWGGRGVESPPTLHLRGPLCSYSYARLPWGLCIISSALFT